MQITRKHIGHSLYIIAILLLLGNLLLMFQGNDIGYLYPLGLIIFMFGHLVLSQAKKAEKEEAESN